MKLFNKVEIGYYLGPDKTSNEYCIWNPNKKTVSIEQNIRFSKESDETQISEKLPKFNILSKAEIVSVKPNSFNYWEAMKDEFTQQWKEAMDTKVGKLEKQNLWTYTISSKEVNIVRLQFVYATKWDANGNVTGRHVRLVVQRFLQIESVDYFQDRTFSLVAKMQTVRLLDRLAVKHNWELH